MTKKSTSKMPVKSSHKGPSVEKPSLKRKKMGSEIDEIFAAKKKKKPENNEKKTSTSEKPRKVSSSTKVKSNGKKSRSLNENEGVGPTSRSRRKTADGLTLYTEEELGFGKSDAGGTPLCPFDCDCCF